MAKRPKLNPAQERVFKALDSHTRRRDTNGAPLYCCDCGANENRKGNIAHSFDCVVSVAVLALAAETERTETIFGCRTCPASTPGWSDGRFASPGWGRIDHIDGPNAICPVCAADTTALDCLREEYPAAETVKGVGREGRRGVMADEKHCHGCEDPSYTASHGCPGVVCQCEYDSLRSTIAAAESEVTTLRTTLARLTAEVATYQRALQLALCLCDPPSVDACKEWIADREARDEEFGQ